MDGFVASVVIAALAIIALGGVYSVASSLTFTCPTAPAAWRYCWPTLRKKAPHIPHMRGQARP